jgi:predicted transposase YdaD
MQLFEASKIASFSQEERDAYENSLKYYRDLKGVVDTAREEGIQEGKIQGIQEGKAQGIQEGKLSLLLKQLARKLGIIIPDEIKVQLYQLDPNVLDTFSEALFDLENLEDLHNWLKSINNR